MVGPAIALTDPEAFLRVGDLCFETDTVVVVTGAPSGAGRATVATLASNGRTVVGAETDLTGDECATTDVHRIEIGKRRHWSIAGWSSSTNSGRSVTSGPVPSPRSRDTD